MATAKLKGLKSFNLGLWLCFAILFLLPSAGISKHYLNLLTLAGILGLAVVGMDLIMGFTGLLSLGQGGFMAIGAYTSAILTVKYGVAPLPALAAAQLITLVIAMVIGKAVIRLKGYHLAISTLAFSVIMEQLMVNTRALTGGPSGLAGVPVFKAAGISISAGRPMYYLVLVLLFLVIVLLKNIIRSRVGRAWQSIAGDQLAASHLGVNTDGYKLLAFAIAASLAALGGSLYTHYMRFIAPEMVGMQASINITVMTALGGLGTLWGPLLGTLLLTFLPDFLTFTQNFQLIINGLVLLLTMLFFPRGLSGLIIVPYHWLLYRFGSKNLTQGGLADEPGHLVN